MKTPIHPVIVSTLLALGLSISSASGEWSETVISTSPYSSRWGELTCDVGRNDGVKRLYVNYNYPGGPSYGSEYSWISGSWVQSTFKYGYSKGLAIGPCRTDGLNRVYSGGNEWAYSSPSWNSSNIFGSDGNDVELRMGRHDGVNRLYVARDNGLIHEYTWVQSTTSYSDLPMPSAPSSLNRIAFGNARNDGVQRLCGVTAAGELCEWTYSSAWSLESTNLGIGQLLDIAIGSPRGDGLNRIYLSCADGLVYETTWNGTAWIPVGIGFGTQEMKAIVIGITRNDGMMRVLVGNQDGKIHELTFQNGNWTQGLVFQSSGAVQGLAIGTGRNDGVNRIYATRDFSLKEYTYTPTTSAPFAAQLLPNGILEWSSTPGSVYDVEWSSDLSSWHGDWSSLSGIPATGTSTQQPIPRFFRVKRRTE